MAVEQANPSAPPDPDDPRKPDSPTDLTKPSLLFVLRKTVREFQQDQCTDLAAALTYYAVLSLFPALLALVSLLGVFGQGRKTVDAVLDTASGVVPGDAMDLLRQPIEQLVQSPSAGIALVTGLLGAVWSASGYIGAFGRAMNRIYEIDEGRPVWKLRPLQLLLTLAGLLLAAAAAVMLAVSGPVAESVGNAIGVGSMQRWRALRRYPSGYAVHPRHRHRGGRPRLRDGGGRPCAQRHAGVLRDGQGRGEGRPGGVATTDLSALHR